MVDRVAAGNLGSGLFGLRVSKEGVDVLTGSEASLMFDSNAANTRIIMTGSISGTFDSFNRTNISNIEIQLPTLDYEPLVFVNFIARVQDGVVSGVSDDQSNKRFAAHWMGGNPNANPKDYTEFTWNASTNKMKFNARSLAPNLMGKVQLMDFRYIVFSNRSN